MMTDDERSTANRRPISREPAAAPPRGVRPGRTTLGGDFAALTPLDAEVHAEGLYRAGHDSGGRDSVWEYLPYGPFDDADAMRAFLRTCAGSADPLWFAIHDTGSGNPMGMASFMEVRPTAGIAEIGHIWFGPAYQNSRGVTEALYLMMREVMDGCGYRRLEWKCDAANEASRRAALRLGFRYEGTFLNHNVIKGRNRDTAWYSLTDAEWPGVRTNLQRWLDSGNFDDDGKPIQSLRTLNAALW
ncbi:MAG: GNAT family protein [Ectothiorhodospiraceae bacterium]|jgi:RimJ/RimL family protein N-acetyltransferase